MTCDGALDLPALQAAIWVFFPCFFKHRVLAMLWPGLQPWENAAGGHGVDDSRWLLPAWKRQPSLEMLPLLSQVVSAGIPTTPLLKLLGHDAHV